MDRKCRYCGKESYEEFCTNGCRNGYECHMRHNEDLFGIAMWVAVAMICVFTVLNLFYHRFPSYALMMLMLGVFLLLFPYIRTSSRFPLKKAELITRICGALLAVAGAILIFNWFSPFL